jgi:hypothetical protein
MVYGCHPTATSSRLGIGPLGNRDSARASSRPHVPRRAGGYILLPPSGLSKEKGKLLVCVDPAPDVLGKGGTIVVPPHVLLDIGGKLADNTSRADELIISHMARIHRGVFVVTVQYRRIGGGKGVSGYTQGTELEYPALAALKDSKVLRHGCQLPPDIGQHKMAWFSVQPAQAGNLDRRRCYRAWKRVGEVGHVGINFGQLPNDTLPNGASGNRTGDEIAATGLRLRCDWRANRASHVWGDGPRYSRLILQKPASRTGRRTSQPLHQGGIRILQFRLVVFSFPGWNPPGDEDGPARPRRKGRHHGRGLRRRGCRPPRGPEAQRLERRRCIGAAITVGWPRVGWPRVGWPRVGWPRVGWPPVGWPPVGSPVRPSRRPCRRHGACAECGSRGRRDKWKEAADISDWCGVRKMAGLCVTSPGTKSRQPGPQDQAAIYGLPPRDLP